jgi:Ser/Thr protein kinase RdoA (MazF antagonist)
MGAYLACLGQALKGFRHPGSNHGLLWDMQQALQLRRILEHIDDEALRRGAAQVLDDFETLALPQFATLRSQVIHSDLNPENLLIVPGDHDVVAGVIDFGDMLRAPLVVDVAIGAAYLGATDGNPLASIAEFLVGYHSVVPLELAEIDLLFDLIKTRLAASVSIMSWRASLRGADDPYLAGAVASEGSAAGFLRILLQLPRDNARQVFRQICASGPADDNADAAIDAPEPADSVRKPRRD